MPRKKILSKALLKGIPVSEGVAIGKAWILESPWDEVAAISLKKEKTEREVRRYERAIKEVAKQLVRCRNRVKREIGPEEAKIFHAHLSILNDPFFQNEIPKLIREKQNNAEYVLKLGINKWIKSFSKVENDYFRDRIDDIRDVAVRILRILLSLKEIKFSLKEPAVLIAHNLTPSDTARIDPEKILGFATELGGKTSHAAIIARSLGIPAVVGIDKLMKKVSENDTVIVDGNTGIVHIDPLEDVLKGYQKRQKQFTVYRKRLSEIMDLPAVTRDGVEVSLQANIAMAADISLAARYMADGIGLFRTELPFLLAGRLLTESEQFRIYRTVVEAMEGKTVTIRTLDLGGDKFLPFQGIEKEHNPFLGWRSIRISLQERDIFKTQLRAIFKASRFGKVKVLFPMISSLDEILEIQKIIGEIKKEFKRKEIEFDANLPVGIMVEVPSAAILADYFLQYVDYLSIGTNDLIQYTLAVDRNNERVAKFYQPLNPAVLSLIKNTIRAANQAGKSVSLCGEMAGNPLYTPMLLGFGLRQFSMSPLMLPEVKERVRAVSVEECEKIAEEILQMGSAEEIEKVLWAFNAEANKRQPVAYMERTS